MANAAVSPRRAAAARDDMTEDEWTQGHRPDPLGAIKTGRHVVSISKANLPDCLSCLTVHFCRTIAVQYIIKCAKSSMTSTAQLAGSA